MVNIDVMITDKALDTTDQLLNDPFSGEMSPTYQKVQDIAEKHGGSWIDWEPYRVTFGLPDNNKARSFIIEIHNALPIEVTFQITK